MGSTAVLRVLSRGVRLLDLLLANEAVEPQSGGTGLANARARLATLHGDAAGITLRREDGRTCVRVTLPARAQGAA